jgi:transcription-repair coupling factor (superfamily II helicase)
MILDNIRQLSSYQTLLDSIRRGVVPNPLSLIRSVRLPIVAGLWQDLNLPVLFITSRQEKASSAMDELEFWQPGMRIFGFTEPTPLFYEEAGWSSNTRQDRLATLTSLAGYHLPGTQISISPPVIISSAKSLMTRTMPRRDYLKSIMRIANNTQKPQNSLIEQLVQNGYQFVEIVVEPGQFSHRGGVIDIWAMGEKVPVRLDYFGDDIETIKLFDPATQRTIEKCETINVPPAREFLLRDQSVMVSGKQYSEFHLPLLHSFSSTLIDYLPKNSLVILDDGVKLESIVNEVEEDAVKMRNEGIHSGFLPEDFPVPYLSWSELQDSMVKLLVLDLGYGSSEQNSDLSSCFYPNQRYAGQLKNFVDDLLTNAQVVKDQYVVSRQVPRIKEVWMDNTGQLDTAVTEPVFIDGSLYEGWHLKDGTSAEVIVYSDSEIFGWEKPHSRRQQLQIGDNPEAQYADLSVGDWVVHIDYGIGQFIGLVKRVLDGIRREFLAIEYQGGDQLFVPIHQADRLSRYVGPDSQRPTASRLGSNEWTTTKNRVRGAVQEVAGDLLDLYAQRQIADGFSFSKDSAWQMELEGSFPYIETPDQVNAIRQVKQDMENPRPMDRLLCGDVGYGKTEVALRAAFKAVMDGKQVAILVPTTILAQQHFDTFKERLLPFPAVVEMLSRFRSPREQDEIIRKLGMGQVDIIIGTHRLVQADVQFKDLGLVIIDEEQRFGVTHKEFLKKLRTEVDVLTLTATPIPRTLYMALTGVRDISTINTPPEERLPINTHIGPYSPHLVRQAILRELERGGQVFFLHNRVHSIPAMLMHLQKLVPEARYGIGHGQLEEHELAKVMHRFTHNEIDVLLCTSIIESGLDIPNANTLIVDRADTFGLAQLYQLRGRVGRGAQRAYAYFFRHRSRAATPDGQERLEVIAENTQLGAGYSIAMRDMEIRGAGELLGTRQHGYINSVGFHLYTQMLSSAVKVERKLRGLPDDSRDNLFVIKELSLPVAVDLPLAVELPTEYIADQNTRLKLYRRMADVSSPDQLDAMAEELQDRFGEIPQEVANLFYQLRVKLLAEMAGLASVYVENGQLVLRYPQLPEGFTPRNLPFINLNLRSGKNSYWMPLDPDDKTWQNDLLQALNEIIYLTAE